MGGSELGGEGGGRGEWRVNIYIYMNQERQLEVL